MRRVITVLGTFAILAPACSNEPGRDPGLFGSTDDPGDGDGDGGNVPCDVEEADLEPVPFNVVLVLDKSGSMVSNKWDHDADDPDENGFLDDGVTAATPKITRWQSLHAVVDDILTGYESKINFGATLFPAINAYFNAGNNQTSCLMANNLEVAVQSNAKGAVLSAIPTADATNLEGGTPAAAGLQAALSHLQTLPIENPQAIFFVTDGAANCNGDAGTFNEFFETYDDDLHTVVADAWSSKSIPTYVIGIDIKDAMTSSAQDGSPDNINPFSKLNELANQGGTPKGGAEDFYSANNQIELEVALQSIAAAAVSCTVPLEEAPSFPDLLEVYVADQAVPHVANCASEDGWVYTNVSGPFDSIELCGSWCAELKEAGELRAEYYCDPG